MLDARIRAYAGEAIALAKVSDSRSEEALRHFLAIQKEAEGPLLTSLEDTVNHYERLANEKTNQALFYEIVIAALLIALLAAVGLALFRPLVKRAQTDLNKIVDLAADVEAKEKRLSSILATLADGVVTLDEAGTIVSVNQAAEKIFGYGSAEVVGKNFRFLLPKSERRGRMSFFAHYARSGHAGSDDSSREIVALRKNGREFQMELSVSSLELDGRQLFTSVVRDITDRKKAETTLKRQAWVMENIADAVILTDPQGNIIDCNPRAEELTGYERVELLGTPVMDLMISGSVEMRGEVQTDARAITDTGDVWRHEFQITRKDGTVRTFDNTTTGMFDERQRLIGRISVNHDVTEQREVDGVKNDFISVVSHELRTPLTSIMGSLGLIKSGAFGDVDDEVSGMIDIAYSNSDRLVRLINDILDLEKIEAGRMDFSIAPLEAMALLVQAVTDNAGYGDKHDVHLDIVSPVKGVYVAADMDKVAQVFANLLSNAIKFSPAGATVEIGAHRRGQKIRFYVKDYGPGIPDDFRSAIFSKFSQADSSAKRKQGGTGLGLSICKTIVERLGGEIGFESKKGQGAKFFFDLPEAESPAEIIPMAALGKTALVVEDDQDAATLLRIILEDTGLTVEVDLDLETAQAAVTERKFDIVTLDLGLGGACGVDLLETIAQSEINAGLPVIVVTGRQREDVPDLEGGAFDLAAWVTKPIDIDSLKGTLHKCLNVRSTEKPRVLHVEDDPDIRAVVKKILGHSVEIIRAESLAVARTVLTENNNFDLVLLDLALGDGRGEELLPDLRTGTGAYIPVVVFSGNDLDRSAEIEKVTHVLQKSRTSNEDLAACVMSAIQRHHRTEPAQAPAQLRK
jgi:PAS domain S-box-containing protein